MRIGQFNARGPHNGVEHWFDLICDELHAQGHQVKQFWFRGNQPSLMDRHEMEFAIFHFSQVANYYKKLGVPFCIMPSANDCFPDNGATLKKAASHKNCKFITYQSFYHLEKYKEWDIPKPKVYVPMPVRINLFKRETPYNPETCSYVAGGRLIPKKGLDRLTNVENLTVFGDGPLRNMLSRTLHPSTKFTGFLDGKELRDLFEKSTVYLFPATITSDGDSEGISNTIKEALLMELPVICTPIAGNREFENVEFLSNWDNIKEVLDDAKFERNYKGRQEILRTYSPKSCVKKLLDGIKDNE